MTCKLCGGPIKRTGFATGECEHCGQPYAGYMEEQKEKMVFGRTFEKRMGDLISATFMACARSLTHFALGKYGEAQHWLGRARRRLDDLQGELSDEISKRRGE